MSVENGEVCCNCRHCIRKKSYVGILNGGYKVTCHCEIDHCDLGYIEVMTYQCKHWAKDEEGAEECLLGHITSMPHTQKGK